LATDKSLIYKNKMADGRCPDMLGQNWYGVDADGGAYWRHLGIPLNCPCAAAMRPYVKLL